MSSTDIPKIVTLKAYLQLCRLSNLPTVWMNLIAGFLLSGGRFSSTKMSLMLFGVSAMYCGGMVMNDCIDCRDDAVRRPDRPIPSGRINVVEASFFCIALLVGSMAAIRAVKDTMTFYSGLILLGLVILYNATHNRSILAVVPMAGCRAMIFIMAGFGFSRNLQAPLLVLAAVQFVYIIALSLLSRLEKIRRINQQGRPLIPLMLAGIPVIDGLALAWFLHLGWLVAGLAGGGLTLTAQTWFRGD